MQRLGWLGCDYSSRQIWEFWGSSFCSRQKMAACWNLRTIAGMAAYHFLGITQNQKSWSKTMTLSDSPFSDTGFWWTLMLFFQIQDSSEKNMSLESPCTNHRNEPQTLKLHQESLETSSPHLSMNLPHALPPWGVASNRLEVLPHQFFHQTKWGPGCFGWKLGLVLENWPSKMPFWVLGFYIWYWILTFRY